MGNANLIYIQHMLNFKSILILYTRFFLKEYQDFHHIIYIFHLNKCINFKYNLHLLNSYNYLVYLICIEHMRLNCREMNKLSFHSLHLGKYIILKYKLNNFLIHFGYKLIYHKHINYLNTSHNFIHNLNLLNIQNIDF